MKKENPFSIVMDAYESEAEQLFNELSKDLPEFRETDDEILKLRQKLLRSAFAVICEQFLHQMAGCAPYEDMPQFYHEMGFQDQREACFYLIGKEGIEWDEGETKKYGTSPFDRMLSDLLCKYREWWIKEIIDPADFIEGIFGENEPSDFDSWEAQRFFDNY
jgi:hypothetical protein